MGSWNATEPILNIPCGEDEEGGGLKGAHLKGSLNTTAVLRITHARICAAVVAPSREAQCSPPWRFGVEVVNRRIQRMVLF